MTKRALHQLQNINLKVSKKDYLLHAWEAQDIDKTYLEGSRPFFNNNDVFWKVTDKLNKKYPEQVPNASHGYCADEINRELERISRNLINKEFIKIKKEEMNNSFSSYTSMYLTPKGYAHTKGFLGKLIYWLISEENLWKIISPAIAIASLIVSIIALNKSITEVIQ